MKLQFHPMEPRKEADETKKRGDADEDISSLGGFSGEAQCSSLSMLAFRTRSTSLDCPVNWLLSLREGGLRMRLDLLQEYAYGCF